MSSYGYLEIYWPDNPVESFILPKTVIAIGRSSGNDLVIDREGVSRYHAKLYFEEQQALLTDLTSVNGVYVDGIRLTADEPRTLKGGEEVQLADVRFIYYPPALVDETITTHLEETLPQIQVGLFSVQVAAPDMPVIPGSHVQASITLDNLSTEVGHYMLQVEGIPREWVRIQRSEIELNGGEQTTVLVNFKPLRRSETQPKQYVVTFKVTPKQKPELTVSVEATLSVGVYSGFGVAMGTEVIEDNQPFEVHVHNQGNGQLGLDLIGVDPQNVLDIRIDPPSIILNGGERRTIRGTVRLKRGAWIGTPKLYRYDVVARAKDASQFQAPVSGKYLSKPLLPASATILLLPLIAILVILVVGLVATLVSPEEEVPAPQLISLQIQKMVNNQANDTWTDPTQVELTAGEALNIMWQSRDAEKVQLSYGLTSQTSPQILTPESLATSQLIPFESSGDYTILVEVQNTAGTDQRQFKVLVNPHIAVFTSDPSTLIRDVKQVINFKWEAVGAATPLAGDLTFPDGSSQPIVTGRNTFAYEIQPIEEVPSLSFNLRINGMDNTVGQLTLNVAISEPRCQIRDARPTNQPIYEGPATVYNLLGETETQVIRPLARSEDNQWLQLETGWVLADNFACEGFEVAALRLANAADILPSPTPLPTATLTPTVTPTTPVPTATTEIEASPEETAPPTTESLSTPNRPVNPPRPNG